MTDFQISREEWAKVTNILERVDRTMIQLLEREKHRDSEVVRAQATADKALEVAYEAKREIIEVRSAGGNNTKIIDDWRGAALKIAVSLTVLGVGGIFGYVVAG